MMPRYYIEQRAWMLGAELAKRDFEACELPLDALLASGATARVRTDSESFSNFEEPGEFDHLRIDFDATALDALRRQITCEGFSLLRMIPRLSQHGYLSLTTVFAFEDSIALETVEPLGIRLALSIDRQWALLDGICAQLERLGVLTFPYRYRFGVPDALRGTAHTPLHAFGFNQHVLLPAAHQLEEAASALRLDPATHLTIDGFHVLSGWSVFLSAPERPEGDADRVDQFTRLVLLDNVLAVQVTVLACGLSVATAFLGEILRNEPGVRAYAARQSCLVHRRIEQHMKLRERELLEVQKRYVAGQFSRSDHGELRESYDRAEASLLSAAEGLEAARQERTATHTNVILSIVAVLGVLTVFTTAIDFGYWLPMEQRVVNPAARRTSLLFFTLFLLAVVAFVTRLILQASDRRQRTSS